MAQQRCGCGGQCTCDIRTGPGLSATGNGNPNNPLMLRFDPRQGGIIGTGLSWDEQQRKLTARISADPGNIVTEGTDGGLYAYADGGGVKPPAYGATVAALPTTDMVCGIGGAGFWIAPDSTIAGVRSAATYAVDATLLQVETLQDGICVVHHWGRNRADQATLRRITDEYRFPWQPDYTNLRVSDLTVPEWRALNVLPSRYFWATPDPDPALSVTMALAGGGTRLLPFSAPDGRHSLLDPAFGFFGYGEQNQTGGVFLSDAAREIGNRVVMILDVEDERAFGDLWRIITHYALQSSVIVVSQNLSLLGSYHAKGLPVGVYSPRPTTPPSVADAQAAGCAWALLDKTTDDATFSTYKDAGISTLMLYARYHSDYQRVNTTLAIRGGATGDPVYYTGPRNNAYQYRPNMAGGHNFAPNWAGMTIDYGQFNDGEEPVFARPRYRGHHLQGSAVLRLPIEATWRSVYPDDPNASDDVGSWYIQHGESGPKPRDTFAIEVTWAFDREGLDGNSEMALAFAVPADHAFRDGGGKDAQGNPYRTEQSVGYVLRENQAGHMTLFQINGNKTTDDVKPLGTYDGPANGTTPQQRAVCVYTDRIEVYRGTSVVITVNSAPTYKGGYAYIGKRDFPTNGPDQGRFALDITEFTVQSPWPAA